MWDGFSFREVLRIWLVSLSSLKNWLVMSTFFCLSKEVQKWCNELSMFCEKIIVPFLFRWSLLLFKPDSWCCYFQQKWIPYPVFIQFCVDFHSFLFKVFISSANYTQKNNFNLFIYIYFSYYFHKLVFWHISRYSHHFSYHLCLCVLLEHPVFFLRLVLYSRPYQL